MYTTTTTAKPAVRSLSEIAGEIRKDWSSKEYYDKWGTGIYFGAVPYLDAMATLDKVSDSYGWDSGKSIVLYFLSNATTWKGETAKRIKLELKALCK